MGRQYHGNPVGRLVQGIYEPVTTNFVNHADASLAETTTLMWNPAERRV